MQLLIEKYMKIQNADIIFLTMFITCIYAHGRKMKSSKSAQLAKMIIYC